MKLYIAKEEDRIAVAGILVKNGYAVRVCKEPLKPGSKTMRHFLETVDLTKAEREEDT